MTEDRVSLSRRYEKLLRAAVSAASADCGKRMANLGAPAVPSVRSHHEGDGTFVVEVRLRLPPADGPGCEEWV